MNNRPEQRKDVNVVLLADENKNFVNGYVDLFTAAEEDSEEVTDHYRAPVMINADSLSFKMCIRDRSIISRTRQASLSISNPTNG